MPGFLCERQDVGVVCGDGLQVEGQVIVVAGEGVQLIVLLVEPLPHGILQGLTQAAVPSNVRTVQVCDLIKILHLLVAMGDECVLGRVAFALAAELNGLRTASLHGLSDTYLISGHAQFLNGGVLVHVDETDTAAVPTVSEIVGGHGEAAVVIQVEGKDSDLVFAEVDKLGSIHLLQDVRDLALGFVPYALGDGG